MSNYLVVDTLTQLNAIQNHPEGEVIYCTETQKIYTWQDDKYVEVGLEEGKGLELNLYDLNKNIVSQMEPLSADAIEAKMDVLQTYYENVKNNYYMLLCKEYNYYTMFEGSSGGLFEPFANVVKEIITDLGDIYSIELTEDKMAIELWIKPNQYGEEEPMVFYLFAYDAGVVSYG